jgi:hypothetical protein
LRRSSRGGLSSFVFALLPCTLPSCFFISLSCFRILLSCFRAFNYDASTINPYQLRICEYSQYTIFAIETSCSWLHRLPIRQCIHERAQIHIAVDKGLNILNPNFALVPHASLLHASHQRSHPNSPAFEIGGHAHAEDEDLADATSFPCLLVTVRVLNRPLHEVH